MAYHTHHNSAVDLLEQVALKTLNLHDSVKELIQLEIDGFGEEGSGQFTPYNAHTEMEYLMARLRSNLTSDLDVVRDSALHIVETTGLYMVQQFSHLCRSSDVVQAFLQALATPQSIQQVEDALRSDPRFARCARIETQAAWATRFFA